MRFRQNIGEKSDEEILAMYRSNGDPAQLGILYQRYVELVYGVCLKYFKDNTKAEDAAMGIFESLIEKVKTHDIRQFRPWLHVVTKNFCLMELRKKNNTLSYDELPPSVQAELVYSQESLHQTNTLEADEEERALKKCIEKLSPQQKHCVEQFYFENKSYREIAEEDGEELGMVRSHIQNGRRNLRICIEKMMPAKHRSNTDQ